MSAWIDRCIRQSLVGSTSRGRLRPGSQVPHDARGWGRGAAWKASAWGNSGVFLSGPSRPQTAIIGWRAGHGCPGHHSFHRLVGWRPDVQSFLTSALLLALFVGAGIVAIVTIRSRFRGRGEDRGDWESALAEYKNLRDKGVLSAEEYRKIRTLVEPHIDAVSKQPDPPNPPVGQ